MPKCYGVRFFLFLKSVFTKDEAYLRVFFLVIYRIKMLQIVKWHSPSFTQFFYGKSQLNFSVYGLRTKYLIKDPEL